MFSRKRLLATWTDARRCATVREGSFHPLQSVVQALWESRVLVAVMTTTNCRCEAVLRFARQRTLKFLLIGGGVRDSAEICD